MLFYVFLFLIVYEYYLLVLFLFNYISWYLGLKVKIIFGFKCLLICLNNNKKKLWEFVIRNIKYFFFMCNEGYIKV